MGDRNRPPPPVPPVAFGNFQTGPPPEPDPFTLPSTETTETRSFNDVVTDVLNYLNSVLPDEQLARLEIDRHIRSRLMRGDSIEMLFDSLRTDGFSVPKDGAKVLEEETEGTLATEVGVTAEAERKKAAEKQRINEEGAKIDTRLGELAEEILIAETHVRQQKPGAEDALLALEQERKLLEEQNLSLLEAGRNYEDVTGEDLDLSGRAATQTALYAAASAGVVDEAGTGPQPLSLNAQGAGDDFVVVPGPGVRKANLEHLYAQGVAPSALLNHPTELLKSVDPFMPGDAVNYVNRIIDNPQQLATLQLALVDADFLNNDVFIAGMPDPETILALTLAMSFSNDLGFLNFWDGLELLQQDPSLRGNIASNGGFTQPEVFTPDVFDKEDPAFIANSIFQKFREELGRDPTASEVDKFTEQWQEAHRDEFLATETARKRSFTAAAQTRQSFDEFEDPTAAEEAEFIARGEQVPVPTITDPQTGREITREEFTDITQERGGFIIPNEPAPVQGVNPVEQFYAAFRDRYGDQIQLRESEATQRQSNQQFASTFGVMSSMMRSNPFR